MVKLFGGQVYESDRFNEKANWVRRYNMKQAMAASANVPIVQMIAAIALSVIIYIATVQSRSDETTVGGFLSFIAAMLMLTAPIKRMTGRQRIHAARPGGCGKRIRIAGYTR